MATVMAKASPPKEIATSRGWPSLCDTLRLPYHPSLARFDQLFPPQRPYTAVGRRRGHRLRAKYTLRLVEGPLDGGFNQVFAPSLGLRVELNPVGVRIKLAPALGVQLNQ